MAHAPESVEQYVCVNCQVLHAGTPIHVSGGEHRFEPPETCGACGHEEFAEIGDWLHHHD